MHFCGDAREAFCDPLVVARKHLGLWPQALSVMRAAVSLHYTGNETADPRPTLPKKPTVGASNIGSPLPVAFKRSDSIFHRAPCRFGAVDGMTLTSVTLGLDAVTIDYVGPRVTVPDIIGMSAENGMVALREVGLVGFEEVIPAAVDSNILAQTPAPGTLVPVHSEVSFEIKSRPVTIQKPGEPVTQDDLKAS